MTMPYAVQPIIKEPPLSAKSLDGHSEQTPPGEFVPAGEVGDDEITRNLKRAYQELASEPIPEALMALLQQLDAAEGTPRDGR
jgi:hypothetical protein